MRKLLSLNCVKFECLIYIFFQYATFSYCIFFLQCNWAKLIIGPTCFLPIFCVRKNQEKTQTKPEKTGPKKTKPFEEPNRTGSIVQKPVFRFRFGFRSKTGPTRPMHTPSSKPLYNQNLKNSHNYFLSLKIFKKVTDNLI